jgi:hypothetical protein
LLDTIKIPTSWKLLWRLLQKLLEIILVLELFGDFAFIEIVCILYVIHYFCMYIGLYYILQGHNLKVSIWSYFFLIADFFGSFFTFTKKLKKHPHFQYLSPYQHIIINIPHTIYHISHITYPHIIYHISHIHMSNITFHIPHTTYQHITNISYTTFHIPNIYVCQYSIILPKNYTIIKIQKYFVKLKFPN